MTRYISESELRAWKNNLNKFTIIEPNLNVYNKNIINKLTESKEKETLIPFQEALIKIPGILNTEYRPIFAMDVNQIKLFLNKTNSELIDGDLPTKNTRELILTVDIMEYKGLNIGDYVGNSIDEDEYLWGRFEITGILKSELSLGLSSIEYFKRKTNVDRSKFLLFTESNNNISNLFENQNDYKIRNLNSLIQNHNEKYKDLNRLIFIIILVLIISLIIISCLFILLYLKERKKEFAIYYSNGIKIKNIIIFELKEFSILIILSLILGVSFSNIFLLFLRKVLFRKGVFLATLSYHEYLLTLPIALSIFITLFFVLKLYLKPSKLENIILGDY